MLGTYLKLIDIETIRLYDLIQKPQFDIIATASMNLSRSVRTRKSKLVMLCKGDDNKHYVQRIDFNATIAHSL